MFRASLVRWLHAAPVTGRLALILGIVAVGLATAIRAAIDGIVVLLAKLFTWVSMARSLR